MLYLLKKDVFSPVLPRNVIMGHFRVPKTLNFKTRLSANLSLNEFCWHENKKIFFLSMASPLDSLWNRGLRQLGNSLLSSYCEPTFSRKSVPFLFYPFTGIQCQGEIRAKIQNKRKELVKKATSSKERPSRRNETGKQMILTGSKELVNFFAMILCT